MRATDNGPEAHLIYPRHLKYLPKASEMALPDITAQSVLLACDEYDQLGRTRFLDKYGF